METKEDVCTQEDTPSSPSPSPSAYLVLQNISEEAVRVAGELCKVYTLHTFRHGIGVLRKAWRWGGSLKEEGCQSSFNPEVLANQKRSGISVTPKLWMHCEKEKVGVSDDEIGSVRRQNATASGATSPKRGTSAKLMQRTPSLSDLNELVYGQDTLKALLSAQ
ncbi:hypothetical protein JRO89_XSUnG0024300 [Xanthoceras sorbifolium]|uniref:Uncharacterized protein n=1 Tax=Xanthoceras sorbifolium TaxID=99658 RepID=A0ABQ8H097_9ROSI|nr:hypothetical protein JRO89_XSUnG0024300 [Xanthoceras sorbifolium]